MNLQKNLSPELISLEEIWKQVLISFQIDSSPTAVAM